ncbi:Malate dehydrogenase, mitochondrial [Capsicum annuum]|nr:Malate dehydrogenase, mitochondrial [Capsicum annuum]
MLYNEVLFSQAIDFETAHVFLSSYAGAIFANAYLKGLNRVPDVVECSFVQSNVTELPFFASKLIVLSLSYKGTRGHFYYKRILVELAYLLDGYIFSLNCLVRLGKNGEEKVLVLGPLTNYEKKGLEALKPESLSFTKKGIKFANAS